MTQLKCPNKVCGKVWTYCGKSEFYTACPRCHCSVHVKRNAVEQENK